jgi:hypothetical protein
MKEIKRTWKELNEYKESLNLTQEQREIIIGSSLGDLNIRKIGKASRLVFDQKNKDYLFHLYNIFESWVRTPPKERLQQRLPTSNLCSNWHFSTLSHKELHFYYTLFYPQGKKLLPQDIQEYLTPRSIAYWIMDDGCLVSKNKWKIATCGFTMDENILLVNALNNKFNISANITLQEKRYPILNITSPEFKHLIEPYVVPSMKYKLDNSQK